MISLDSFWLWRGRLAHGFFLPRQDRRRQARNWAASAGVGCSLRHDGERQIVVVAAGVAGLGVVRANRQDRTIGQVVEGVRITPLWAIILTNGRPPRHTARLRSTL